MHLPELNLPSCSHCDTRIAVIVRTELVRINIVRDEVRVTAVSNRFSIWLNEAVNLSTSEAGELGSSSRNQGKNTPLVSNLFCQQLLALDDMLMFSLNYEVIYNDRCQLKRMKDEKSYSKLRNQFILIVFETNNNEVKVMRMFIIVTLINRGKMTET